MTLHDHTYSNFNISISFKRFITFAGSTGNLGSVRGRSLKAGRIRRLWRQQCLVILPAQPQDTVFFSFLLSSFFFLLSGNTSFSHTSLHPILTKLGQSDRYLDHYSGTDNGGVRGHDGVTGVKKVIFTKKASSPTEYLALTRDLCICSSLTPSTKVMVLKNCQGSFGVTEVKSSFSQKKASSPSDYVALTRDLCICSSLTPSTKVMVLKKCPGSFGVTGVKRSFSLKML